LLLLRSVSARLQRPRDQLLIEEQPELSRAQRRAMRIVRHVDVLLHSWVGGVQRVVLPLRVLIDEHGPRVNDAAPNVVEIFELVC
jgi:hypothetical protein